MQSLVVKNQIDEKTWTEEAEKNAEYRAKIFIDLGQHEKAAKALKELPYKKSLIFLYKLGKKYLLHHDKRAEAVARTSDLIEKKKIDSKHISLNTEKLPQSKHIPKIKRHTIAEVFEL